MKSLGWLILDILILALLFSACFPREYKTQHPELVHGGITADGKYDFSVKNSIVTKDAIKCTKFKLSRDFNADYNVIIYYYGPNNVFIKAQQMTGDDLDIGYYQMPDGAESIRIAISNFAGFSDWDCFRFRWWDLGLKTSTKEQFFLIAWFDDVKDFFGDLSIFDSNNNSEGEIETSTGDFPDMIYPGGDTVL